MLKTLKVTRVSGPSRGALGKYCKLIGLSLLGKELRLYPTDNGKLLKAVNQKTTSDLLWKLPLRGWVCRVKLRIKSQAERPFREDVKCALRFERWAYGV